MRVGSGGRIFWRPTAVQYFQDSFQNIRHQATADTGIGYQLIDSSRVEWDIQGSIGANYLRKASAADAESDDEVSPVVTLGSDLTVELTSWLDYELLVNMTFLNGGVRSLPAPHCQYLVDRSHRRY